MGLDAVELIIRLEEVFEIRFIDAEVELVETVGQLEVLICEYLQRQNRFCGLVFETIRDVLHDDYGVRLEMITREARVVHDLGLD
jgi:hypothetical protein